MSCWLRSVLGRGLCIGWVEECSINYLKIQESCGLGSGLKIIPLPCAMILYIDVIRQLLDVFKVSISSTFYARVFHTIFLPQPKRNQKKLPKLCLYEKFVRKNVDEIDPRLAAISEHQVQQSQA